MKACCAQKETLSWHPTVTFSSWYDHACVNISRIIHYFNGPYCYFACREQVSGLSASLLFYESESFTCGNVYWHIVWANFDRLNCLAPVWLWLLHLGRTRSHGPLPRHWDDLGVCPHRVMIYTITLSHSPLQPPLSPWWRAPLGHIVYSNIRYQPKTFYTKCYTMHDHIWRVTSFTIGWIRRFLKSVTGFSCTRTCMYRYI